MPAIIKPSKLGVAMRPEPVPGGGLLTISAFLLVDFDSPRQLLTEQALWPMVTEQMAPGAIFDKGSLKPTGELIIAGAALSPGGAPVSGLNVIARIGAIEKRLAVFGDRYWRLTERGVVMLDAAPFEQMPIDAAHAFGGPAFKDNPHGKGHGARAILDAGYDAALPNVENPARLIRSLDDMPRPAFFGPMAADAAARMRFAGTYDQNWIKNRAPMKPDDFNPMFHCDAPEDQRLGGYFVGDEAFSVAGMSRGAGIVAGQLPNLVVRAFIHRPSDDSLTETRMVCETVTLFPNVSKVVVTFRGLAKTLAPLCDDIGTVMLACESREAAPRPAGYYLDIFRLRTDPEQAHKHALSDFQLLPERDAVTLGARRTARLQKAGEDRILFMENQNWAARKTLADQGLSPSLVPPVDMSVLDELPLVPLPTDADMQSGDFDIAELIDDIEKLDAAMWLKADREMAGAELTRQALVRSTPDHLLPPHMRRPIVSADELARFPDLSPSDALDESAFAAALSMRPVGFGEDLEGEAADRMSRSIDDVFSLLDVPSPDDPGAVEAQFVKACARALRLAEGSLLHDVRLAVGGAEYGGFNAGLDAADADPDLMKAIVDRMDAVGKTPLDGLKTEGVEIPPLARDIAPGGTGEVDDALARTASVVQSLLPGLAASQGGAHFEDMLAELQAGLPSDLGAEGHLTLDQAIASKTSEAMQRLDAAEADVVEVMEQSRRQSPAAIFPMEPFLPTVSERFGDFIVAKLAEGHDFGGADLAGADLSGADLSGLDLRSTFFERCDLRGAIFAGANLEGAVFTEADLESADLTGARLNGANFGRAKVRGARFDNCSFEGSTFIGVDMTDASFRAATLEKLTLIECVLDRADLTGATLSDIQVLRGQADGLVSRGTVIARVAFLSLSMKGADFSEARLERVSFAEIQAPGGIFSKADFRSCAFLGHCDLSEGFFDRITATESSWNTTRLDRSCFLRADCGACLFNGCDMTEADLRLASFKNARLDLSVLVGCDFFGANFFAASLGACDLTRASLRCANLFLANLDGASLGSCDFTGANLGKTQMEHATDA